MNDRLPHPGSWWAHPSVQCDRAAFSQALSQHLDRMTTDRSPAAKMDALVTAQFSLGFPGGRKAGIGAAWGGR